MLLKIIENYVFPHDFSDGVILAAERTMLHPQNRGLNRTLVTLLPAVEGFFMTGAASVPQFQQAAKLTRGQNIHIIRSDLLGMPNKVAEGQESVLQGIKRNLSLLRRTARGAF